jgi:hypothetical protein
MPKRGYSFKVYGWGGEEEREGEATLGSGRGGGEGRGWERGDWRREGFRHGRGKEGKEGEGGGEAALGSGKGGWRRREGKKIP